MGDERSREAVPGHRRWWPGPAVGLVLGAVLAAVAVFVLPGTAEDRPPDEVARAVPAAPPTTSTDPAEALTTSTDPAEALRQLADRAGAQPPVAEGPFDYIHLRQWDRGRNPATNQFVGDEFQIDQQRWVGAESGRVLNFTDEVLQFDDPLQTRRPSKDLPTEPDALERALLAGDPDPWTWPKSPCFAMRSVWELQVVEPAVQAAFLRLLASHDAVRMVGPVLDRLDRPGIAVEVTEPAALGPAPDAQAPDFVHALILDPRTGGVLSWDSILVGGGGDPLIHVDTPGGVVNVGLMAWVATGRVDSTETRP